MASSDIPPHINSQSSSFPDSASPSPLPLPDLHESDGSPKPAWRKLDSLVESPALSMEASSWPTLAEARQAKPHVSSKDSTASSPQNSSKLSANPKLISLSGVQGSSSRPNRQSNTAPVENNTTVNTKLKPPYKRGGAKHSFPFSGGKTFSHPPPRPPGPHSTPMLLPDQFLGVAAFPAPHPAVGAGPFYYPQLPFNVHSNLQARGNGWAPHQWRGYGYGANNNVYLQHGQYFNPGNAYSPYSPPMNMNLIHTNHQRNMYNGMPISLSYGPHSRPSGGMLRGFESMKTQSLLQKQIEYYFSTENLCKDMYLRSRMDCEGFVPVSLIASFKRVQNLTTNPILILEALQKSSIVEVKGNKIRKSGDWKRWLLPASSSSSNLSNAKNSKDMATTMSFDNILVDKSDKSETHITQVSTDVEICPIGVSDHQDSDDCYEKTKAKEDLIGAFTSSCRSLQSTDAEDNPIQTNNDTVDVKIQYEDASPHDTSCGSMKKSQLVSSSAVVDCNNLIDDNECKDSDALRESSVVDDDSCPSLGDKVKLHKSHSENVIEEDKRRLITVTHAQLSSCIAVP